MQAGMIILRETGGFFSGGKEDFERQASDEDILLSRRCVAVRALAPTNVSFPQFLSTEIGKVTVAGWAS
jgi:hypothetical protein